MKIRLRHPVAIRAAGLLASCLVRAWVGSLDLRFEVPRPQDMPCRRREPGLYLFWHEHLLLPAYSHARERLGMLISTHRDGELIAQTLGCLGGHAIRGSTAHGGAGALRKLMQAGRRMHLAITPDGPRGPRRIVQAGAVFLAAKTGMPIFPVGFAFDHPWRARSWDRTALPRPFSRGRGVLGEAIRVPGELDRDGVEAWRLRVQAALESVQARAEELAGRPASDKSLLSLGQVRREED